MINTDNTTFNMAYEALIMAAESGNVEEMRLHKHQLDTLEDDALEEIATLATFAGQVDSVKLCLDWNVDVDTVLMCAAETENLEILNACRAKGGVSMLEDALECAASVGNVAAVRLMVSWQPIDLRPALSAAVGNDHVGVVDLILSLFSEDGRMRALGEFYQCNSLEMAVILIKWGWAGLNGGDITRFLRRVVNYGDEGVLIWFVENMKDGRYEQAFRDNFYLVRDSDGYSKSTHRIIAAKSKESLNRQVLKFFHERELKAAHQEMIAVAWHPDRFVNWCLEHDFITDLAR